MNRNSQPYLRRARGKCALKAVVAATRALHFAAGDVFLPFAGWQLPPGGVSSAAQPPHTKTFIVFVSCLEYAEYFGVKNRATKSFFSVVSDRG